MKFKTELHCHSAEVSKCATATAEEIVGEYIKYGYSTIVLTNHLNSHTFKNDRFGDLTALSWDEKMDHFMNGYIRMKEAAGDRLNILLGVEIHPVKSACDYMIYGIDEAFLRSNPTLLEMKLRDISELVRASGCFFVQVHPFRNDMKIVRPEYFDGCEVYNGGTTPEKPDRSRNWLAEIWAERYDLAPTSGSDFHRLGDHRPNGGIITESEIKSNEELLRVLRSREYELIRDDKAYICRGSR